MMCKPAQREAQAKLVQEIRTLQQAVQQQNAGGKHCTGTALLSV